VTGQQPDQLVVDGRDYAVTAVDGTGLVTAADLGCEPRPMHTACWRGYVATYAVVEDRLRLGGLDVGGPDRPPDVTGVAATRGPFRGIWRYQGLDVPVPFTGRLLVGREPVPDQPYLNMGFAPAWVYADVLEIRCVDGEVTDQLDRSNELAAVRARGPATRPGPEESTRDWIDRTFSLTFEYSWPADPVS
jgi:hypothetical protein